MYSLRILHLLEKMQELFINQKQAVDQKAAMTNSHVELENNFNGLLQRVFRGELV